MEDKISRLAELITKYLQKDLNPDEEAALQQIINESETSRNLFQAFLSFAESAGLQEALKALGDNKNESDALWPLVAEKYKSSGETKVIDISPKRHRILRYVAAAAALVIIASGLYLWNNFRMTDQPVAKTEDTNRFKNDVPPPEGSKTILTLSDGRKIVLDQTDNGNIASEGKTQVIKKDGQLSYSPSNGGGKGEVFYNTLSTENGGFYQLVLPDESLVWMNAASSITYPTVFIGNERKVTITGEAYFEIKKDTKKKFIVEANGVATEVLGTHFNVNAYGDDGRTRVTLLEGSVKVSTLPSPGGERQGVRLKPGQQALINQSTFQLINPDIEQVMAWKNGTFYFNGETLEGIMKHLERWYDVEVEYETKVPGNRFGGMISRNTRLSEVLKALELSDVHFRIEGRKIIVMK